MIRHKQRSSFNVHHAQRRILPLSPGTGEYRTPLCSWGLLFVNPLVLFEILPINWLANGEQFCCNKLHAGVLIAGVYFRVSGKLEKDFWINSPLCWMSWYCAFIYDKQGVVRKTFKNLSIKLTTCCKSWMIICKHTNIMTNIYPHWCTFISTFNIEVCLFMWDVTCWQDF